MPVFISAVRSRADEQKDVRGISVVEGQRPSIRYYIGSQAYFAVMYIQYKTEPAFKVRAYTSDLKRKNPIEGYLYVTPTRTVFEPMVSKFVNYTFSVFNAERSALPRCANSAFHIGAPGQDLAFFPATTVNFESTVGVPKTDIATTSDEAGVPVCRWLTAASTDFSGAFADFRSLTRDVYDFPLTAAEQRDLATRITAWRAAGAKVELPEEADEKRILAETALKDQNLDRAIKNYRAALGIYPTWPEGQFNLALTCGEAKDYGCAIEHMQAYLELVPDAPNARKAREKIVIWRDKAENGNS
jgi:tetratricopeptide (TPR) repeat protein